MGSGKDILGCPESCVALVPERLAGGDEWCGRQALAVKSLNCLKLYVGIKNFPSSAT